MKKILASCLLALMLAQPIMAGTRTFVTAKGTFKNASIEMEEGQNGIASLYLLTKEKKIPIKWNELSSYDRDLFLLRPIGVYRNGRYHHHDMCQIKSIGQFFILAYSYDMKDPYFKGNKLRYMIIDINDLDSVILKELGKEKYKI